MIKKSIRAKLMILLTAFAVIPVILISLLLIFRTEKIILMLNEKDIEHTKLIVAYYFDQKLSDALILSRAYSENPQIKEAFISSNREKLGEIIKPLFEKEKKEKEVSVFEFGDNKGKVFIRGHNPSKYGDDKSGNKAIEEALKGQEITGFEFGNSGLAARAFTPITNNNSVIGTFQIGYNLNDELLQNISVIISGDISFYEKDLLIKSSNKKDMAYVGQKYEKQIFEYLQDNDSYQRVISNSTVQIYIPIHDSTKTSTIGMICLKKDISYMNKFQEEIIMLIIFFIVILIILSIISSYWFSNDIVIPIKEMQKTLEALSQYRLTLDKNYNMIKILNRTDEIGIIASSVMKMRENFTKLIKVVSAASIEVATSTQELTARSQQLAAAANGVANKIEEIAIGASIQAKEAERGACDINVLSKLIAEDQTFMIELNHCGDEASRLKDEGIDALTKLTSKTTESSKATENVYVIILETEKSVKKIERASQMIKKIAKQTNLLAINASIESTKVVAGNHGFKVVSEEIKKLADEANRFADEIFEVVESLTHKTKQSVTMIKMADEIVTAQTASVHNTAAKFEGIAEAIEKMKVMTEALSGAGKKMQNKKEEIVSSIKNLSAISEQNAEGSKEAAVSVEGQTDSIEEIANASEKLANLSERLQSSIAQFVF